MGAKVTLLLTTPDYATDVQYFLRKVQELYLEAALQIKARFPIGNPLIEMFEVLDPNASHSKFPSLVPLAASFPNIISDCDLQKLDDKWRKLAIATLPFEKEDLEPEEFWGKLLEVTAQNIVQVYD